MLKQSVINKIMDKASEINKACKLQCRDFKIMFLPKYENTLILRWITIDISNEDNPIQLYDYEYFNTIGISQRCPIFLSIQEEINDFNLNLKVLHHQDFAIDHKL